jgi:DMSO/TMAO reductase YedYZ molybdopterin-dependent catalytic subunit
MNVRIVAVVGLALLPTVLVAVPATPVTRRREETQTFRIQGAVERPGEWTAARVTSELAHDLKTVSYTLKGHNGEARGTGEARGVPLLAFVQAAGPRPRPGAKNGLLAFTVVVRCRDGYTVAFSLGELLPDVGAREALLALEKDGKPLAGEEGPAQIIVTQDQKPARWARGIRSILVLDAADLTGRANSGNSAEKPRGR